MKKSIMFILAAFVASAVLGQTIGVSPEKLSTTGTRLTGATAQYIQVGNEHLYAVTNASYYTVAVPTADTWLSVSPATGSSTGEWDTITVAYVTTNLTVGDIYESTVTITQTNAPVTVKTVPVKLKINSDDSVGIAIGPGSLALNDNAIAIGTVEGSATATADGAIQIGAGKNTTASSLQFGDVVVVNGSGNVPGALIASGIPGTAITTGTIPSARIAFAQADTNATTTKTLYTPAHVGQILVGFTASTNTIWSAVGTTTNDWKELFGVGD